MKTSQNGLALIAKFEGGRDPHDGLFHVYRDLAGYDTIGYGHKLRADERFDAPLTEAQALDLLRRDVAASERVVLKYIGAGVLADLNQNQFDALVALTFNVGGAAFVNRDHSYTRLCESLVVENWDRAADCFPLYCHAGGKVVQGLVNRRAAERALFLTPIAGGDV